MMVNETRLVELFKDLCLINAPALQERESVDFVKRHLLGIGLEVFEDDAGSKIGGNAGNLIAKLPANKEGVPSIFFSAHFDTVEPTEGLEIEEIDGVLKSKSDTILGADDKAGMAPAIEAVRMLQESGEPHGDIYLLFCVAEEIGLLGAGKLDIQSLGVEFGYVLDTGPPVGSFVNRTATHDKLDIRVIGKPAHAGKYPEQGIDAIQVFSEAICKMKLGRIAEETTANIGIVKGGTGANVVCPEVFAKGEARSTESKNVDAQIDHMIQCFEEAARNWNTRVEIDHARHYVGYEVDPSSKVIEIARKSAFDLGLGGELRTTLGGSDANQFNAHGVPTIVIGTGMMEIHTHDEYVSRADLVKTAELTYEIACEVAR